MFYENRNSQNFLRYLCTIEAILFHELKLPSVCNTHIVTFMQMYITIFINLDRVPKTMGLKKLRNFDGEQINRTFRRANIS